MTALNPVITDLAMQAQAAVDWTARVGLLETVPRRLGTDDRQAAYNAIARAAYVGELTVGYEFVTWLPRFEEAPFKSAYDLAHARTQGFRSVLPADLLACLSAAPRTLVIFRTILGLTRAEFAAAVSDYTNVEISDSPIKTLEEGGRPRRRDAVLDAIAHTVHLMMTAVPTPGAGLTSKREKMDTRQGWESVQQAAEGGVSYWEYLHHRHYGGAFRQLQDAGSEEKAGTLESLTRELLESVGAMSICYASARQNKEEVMKRFRIRLDATPDFTVYDGDRISALIECKESSDPGTAANEADRFSKLRAEADKLRVPLFAVVDGRGWRRTMDALGPVLRATDGRVFTRRTLSGLVTLPPFGQ